VEARTLISISKAKILIRTILLDLEHLSYKYNDDPLVPTDARKLLGVFDHRYNLDPLRQNYLPRNLYEFNMPHDSDLTSMEGRELLISTLNRIIALSALANKMKDLLPSSLPTEHTYNQLPTANLGSNELTESRLFVAKGGSRSHSSLESYENYIKRAYGDCLFYEACRDKIELMRDLANQVIDAIDQPDNNTIEWLRTEPIISILDEAMQFNSQKTRQQYSDIKPEWEDNDPVAAGFFLLKPKITQKKLPQTSPVTTEKPLEITTPAETPADDGKNLWAAIESEYDRYKKHQKQYQESNYFSKLFSNDCTLEMTILLNLKRWVTEPHYKFTFSREQMNLLSDTATEMGQFYRDTVVPSAFYKANQGRIVPGDFDRKFVRK